MSSRDIPCALRELVAAFAEEYFRGKLSWFRDELFNRSRRYREKLSCNEIDNLGDDYLASLLSEMWALEYLRSKDFRRNLLKDRIEDLREKIKLLSCQKVDLSQDDLSIYKNLYVERFKLAFWSELACLLYPDRFFTANSRVARALKILIDKRVMPEEVLPPRCDIEREECYEKLKLIVGGILKYMREESSDSNYLDVDAFLYFVSEVETKERSEYMKRFEKALGVPPRDILEDWISQAVKRCEAGGVERGLEDPCAKVERGLVERVVRALEAKGQVVLYGVPGTGKTFIARCVARNLAGNRVWFVTFHPSYSYEEFVEGIRPAAVGEGDSRVVEFRVEHGVFKKLAALAICELLEACEALDSRELLEACGAGSEGAREVNVEEVFRRVVSNLDEIRRKVLGRGLERCVNETRHVLVIDEINRGDMARVFGELVTLLERDKRLFAENEMVVELPYSKSPFFVPPNLYIIGTMNSADRSIAFVDYALRRRFAFVELEPDPGLVPDSVEGFSLREFFECLNRYLEEKIDRDHRIGHSYLMNVKTIEELRTVWFTQIRPLLMEYFYGRDDDIKSVLGDLYAKSFAGSDEFKNGLEKALEALRGEGRRPSS